MKVNFPAMRATMGGRTYYSTTMALSEIPRFFKFNDWADFSPEHRAQRTLNTSRIPAISKYILDNEDNYLFSSITCSYSCDLEFEPLTPSQSDLGLIHLELEKMEFVINDGQHRCAAIAQALTENPNIGSHRISVLLFPIENLSRMQQMFSDLNRHANRTSKSLNILYDHRDALGTLTQEVVEKVFVFRGLVDSEKATLTIRSPKLFTLASIYDANKELLARDVLEEGTAEYKKLVEKAVAYWEFVSRQMRGWTSVANNQSPASSVRQETISSHSVVLRALGTLGNILFELHPKDWKNILEGLKDIDWRKSSGAEVNPLWNGVCISAGSVVSNKQARGATFYQIATVLGLDSDTIMKSRLKRRGRPKKSVHAKSESTQGDV